MDRAFGAAWKNRLRRGNRLASCYLANVNVVDSVVADFSSFSQ